MKPIEYSTLSNHSSFYIINERLTFNKLLCKLDEEYVFWYQPVDVLSKKSEKVKKEKTFPQHVQVFRVEKYFSS